MSNIFTDEINVIKNNLINEDLTIDRQTQPLAYAHYIINYRLNPTKDRQSRRAALFSAHNGEYIDGNDLKEVLGYRMRPKSLEHIIDQIEAPSMSTWEPHHILEYIKNAVGGKPGVSLKKIAAWKAEGVVERRVISHIHSKLK